MSDYRQARGVADLAWRQARVAEAAANAAEKQALATAFAAQAAAKEADEAANESAAAAEDGRYSDAFIHAHRAASALGHALQHARIMR